MAEPLPKVRPLPLLARMQARHAHRIDCQRLQYHALLLAGGIVALAGTILLSPRPRLVWNASPSAPIGLYAVVPAQAIARGTMVIAWPPRSARELAARRRYLPRGVPLVKRVAAVEGDYVCARGLHVTVNGRHAAIRQTHDGAGRTLPQWQGCYRLGSGALFLLMTNRADSFDGRYFGISCSPDIVGRAIPLWLL